MNQLSRFHIGRLALPALFGALGSLCAPPALAAVTDISNAPLSSASSLTIKPNLMLMLDSTGSMNFDALPDAAETQQGGSERKYWSMSFNCKWRADSTGFMGNFCDRVDPPFGASDFNGLYYNPQIWYKPALKGDLTSYPPASPTAAACDPFLGLTCDKFYPICSGGVSSGSCFSDYYAGNPVSVNPDPATLNAKPIGPATTYHGVETWNNSGVKNWYGTGTTFNVQTSFPEIVYCRNFSDATSACRRNGMSDATDPTQTGNPFRYTSAIGRSVQTPANPPNGHNGYPEATPVHEFYRPASGSQITVTSAQGLGLTCTGGSLPAPGNSCAPIAVAPGGSYPTLNTPIQVIPRTGTGTSNPGFDTCTGSACTTAVNVDLIYAANQFSYTISGRTGRNLANGGFNMVVPLQTDSANPTGTGTSTSTTVYVTAPNHGLIANDKINMFLLTSNTSILCTNPATVTVLATPAPTANTFAFTTTGCSTLKKNISATGFFQRTNLYNIPKLLTGSPIYYTIQPTEYCSDEYLHNCIVATGPTGAYTYPAPVRFCLTEFDANRLDTPTGMEPSGGQFFRCQKKYNDIIPVSTVSGYAMPPNANYFGYVHPRYGNFLKGTITAGTSASYTGRYARRDCAGNTGSAPTGNCTGNEELANFANWFTYYRDRITMLKTSLGIAFGPIDKSYRVGFITLDPGTPVDPNKYLKIDDFTSPPLGNQKVNWYNKLYGQAAGGGTPTPKALSRIGRHFAGQHDGINQGMPEDPVQYSCQQNFALITTDGYWSERSGKTIKDTSTDASDSIGNQDNNNNCSSTDPHTVCAGVWDGYSTTYTNADQSTAATLADVAQYYYNTDLRSSALGNTTGALGAGTDVSTDNVPTSELDKAYWQHMNTFGVGMAEGVMNWRKDYASASSGDYYNIVNGLSGCSWDPQCRWPVPGTNRRMQNLDDLWHAAVNGRGAFFYARDTAAVLDGLTTALNNLSARNASAAAAATSTPNITPSDRMAFLSSYTTVQWNGEIQAQLIDPNTGLLQSSVVWSAKAQLQALTGPSTDTRNIYTFSAAAPNRLKTFTYANLNATVTTASSPSGGTVTLAAETPWFDNKCVPLTNMSQCTTLDPVLQVPVANAGLNMVNFLRGQTQYEAILYRDRAFALGDTINAAPLFVGKPRQNFVDNVTPSYQQWAAQSSIAGRTPTLYVGANDGMLHAFNANTGVEQWAYVPRIVMPNMWQLADSAYATKHVYFVDGTPTAMDIFDGSNWRTILVGGLNSGGRGYYALDITNPLAPQALWEFCSDSTMCVVSDVNLGLSYGNPIITKNANGKWVVLVTSGYNNVNSPTPQPGDGLGYLYVLDALTGQVLQKIGTGAGSTTSPSGLGKINAWIDTFTTDNTASAVYGGDLQGNIWEFDMNSWPPIPTKIGQALDGSNRVQPITTKPELGLINDTYDVLYVGTGRYLGTSDLTDPGSPNDAWQQSLYAFKISPHDNSDKIYGNLRNVANGLVKQSITILSTTTRTTSASSVNWATSNGWYLDFNPSNDSPGERVSVDPQLVLGTLIVSTNVPNASACSVGGDSWFYEFDYKTGQFVSSSPGGIVGAKITGAEVAGVSIFQLQSGSLGSLVIRTDTTPTQPGINTSSASTAAKRSGWRELTPHH
jgi:type IV pilus assembly protein PilY1